jgi:hypothetical protein
MKKLLGMRLEYTHKTGRVPAPYQEDARVVRTEVVQLLRLCGAAAVVMMPDRSLRYVAIEHLRVLDTDRL